MKWTERINKVMDYVELHLCDSVSEDEVAKIAASSFSVFSTSFSQITGISFSEYIRRRRLTCAAYDLQKYFKDKLDLKLDVQKDTAVAADAKKILVGDTIYSPSNSLAENEFAVRIHGDNLVIEGGHFAMVTKAAKWYESLEVKPGLVATLKGKTDDFKSQVTLNGIT